jgi:hypothetical protein
MKANEFLKQYKQLRDQLDGLIMANVNISIREGNREVWNCNDGIWKNAKFTNFRVVQEFDVESFLEDMIPIIEDIYKLIPRR